MHPNLSDAKAKEQRCNGETEKASPFSQDFIDLRHFIAHIFMDRSSPQTGLPNWNFDSEDEFPVKNDALFFDSDHLNEEGGRLFSEALAQGIDSFSKTGQKLEKT
jgi:hypothetical protein